MANELHLDEIFESAAAQNSGRIVIKSHAEHLTDVEAVKRYYWAKEIGATA